MEIWAGREGLRYLRRVPHNKEPFELGGRLEPSRRVREEDLGIQPIQVLRCHSRGQADLWGGDKLRELAHGR